MWVVRYRQVYSENLTGRTETDLPFGLAPEIRSKRPRGTAMPERPALLIVAEQRELLRQALADAVFYRDPPVDCDACDPVDGLCDECAAGLARATAYLELGEKLGMEVPA